MIAAHMNGAVLFFLISAIMFVRLGWAYSRPRSNPPKDFDVAEVQARAASVRALMINNSYRHYKGGIYTVVSVAVAEATGEIVVVYYSVDRGSVWMRTLDNFTEHVRVGEQDNPRFALLERT